MMAWMRWVLVGSVLATLNACSFSAPDAGPAPREGMTSAAETTVLLWTDLAAGYTLNCADQCGTPSCDCLKGDECLPSVDVDEPCARAGDDCDIIGHTDYTVVRCEARTIATPPASVWENLSGSVESCLDICGNTACTCVHNRCAPSVATETACSTIGASCNLMEGAFYEHLNCVAN